MTVSLFWMAAAVVVAPLLGRLAAAARPRWSFSSWSVCSSPHVLGLASTQGIEMIKQLGMGLLFLLAGMEIELKSLVGRQGRWAWTTWTVGFVVAVFFGSAHHSRCRLHPGGRALGWRSPRPLRHAPADPQGPGSHRHAAGARGSSPTGPSVRSGLVVVMALLLTSHSPLQAGLLMGAVLVTSPSSPSRRDCSGARAWTLARAATFSPWSLRTLLRADATAQRTHGLGRNLGVRRRARAFAAGVVLSESASTPPPAYRSSSRSRRWRSPRC